MTVHDWVFVALVTPPILVLWGICISMAMWVLEDIKESRRR